MSRRYFSVFKKFAKAFGLQFEICSDNSEFGSFKTLYVKYNVNPGLSTSLFTIQKHTAQLNIGIIENQRTNEDLAKLFFHKMFHGLDYDNTVNSEIFNCNMLTWIKLPSSFEEFEFNLAVNFGV